MPLVTSMIAITLLGTGTDGNAAPGGTPDWARDVRPLLAERCLRCHGPDEAARKGKLQLDVRADARRVLGDGDAAASVLLERVTAPDDDRMPPVGGGPRLQADEVELLRRWIDAGARVDPHWAFLPPVATAPPDVAHDERVRDDVDRFVLARLESEGLTPSPEADRRTLARRVALDVIGLPPDPDRVDAFVRDARPDAYERYVDELLADPAFGEHWARPWLDLARYADTKGYEKDARRTMWPYRDWVVQALNDDLPFDQFTIEQLAGDLLPNPSIAQRVATGFHRNTMTNDEGGTDDEEFRSAAVVDRVGTTAETWMALTMACAQCHTHKYDPIRHEEFYRFYAYFNNTADADRADEAPVLAAATRTQQFALESLRRLEAALRLEAERDFDEPGDGPESTPTPIDWFDDETPRGAAMTPPEWPTSDEPPRRGETCWAIGPASELAQLHFLGAADTLRIGHARERLFAFARVDPESPPRTLMLQFHVAGGDWEHRVFWGENLVPWGTAGATSRHHAGAIEDLQADADGWLRLEVDAGTVGLEPGAAIDGIAFTQHSGRASWDAAGILTTASSRQLAHALGEIAELERSIPEVPVFEELEGESRRITRIHQKGSFLSPGDVVEPGIPSIFVRDGQAVPSNRLELARWIVSRDNPLTARVFVNRVWAQIFGNGLVATVEDFGTQGALPSHPELLDTLAVRFMEDGWSIKRLVRTLVTTSTYRQSSERRADLDAVDPGNVYLGRAPRARLSAEAVRDQALAVSGLLDRTVGGPPVFPPQPEGIWQVVYSGDRWMTDDVGARHRRGLYTFWRRTSPYPSMVTFDAPSREFCVSRRVQTNTPLQALVTLNDPAFVEAAIALGRRVLASARTDDDRLHEAFRFCLMRPPTAPEIEALRVLLASERLHFAARADAARELAGLDASIDAATAAEHAAWTVVANVLLNLDEFLTRS